MRVVIESKHTLVVETRGWLMPVVFFGVMAFHASVAWMPLRTMFETSRSGLGVGVVVICAAILTYWLMGYLVFGPLCDKRITTFHGVNKVLRIEWQMPFGVKTDKTFPFTEIECFLLSAPENKGFCGVRFKGGATRKLLRLRRDRDFGILERLDEITHKPVEKVF